jgi:hypothetical protein
MLSATSSNNIFISKKNAGLVGLSPLFEPIVDSHSPEVDLSRLQILVLQWSSSVMRVSRTIMIVVLVVHARLPGPSNREMKSCKVLRNTAMLFAFGKGKTLMHVV